MLEAGFSEHKKQIETPEADVKLIWLQFLTELRCVYKLWLMTSWGSEMMEEVMANRKTKLIWLQFFTELWHVIYP